MPKISAWKKIGKDKWKSKYAELWIDATPKDLIEYNLKNGGKPMEISVWKGAIGTPSPFPIRMFSTKEKARAYAIKHMKIAIRGY